MDRRKSLKTLAVGTLSAGVLLDACKPKDAAETAAKADVKANPGGFTLDRQPQEIKQYEEVTSYTYFTPAEMATITVLADIIIPKDEVSGSATDAKVPEFIEFIVKDQPSHKTPMRGGLRWLDLETYKRHQKSFTDITPEQRIAIVDDIAYPKKVKPGLEQGVAFFTLMRNLTVTGFYTSEMGVKDLGYVGNTPNQWKGVPDDVLKQYNLAYSEKELNETVKFD